MSDLHGSRRSLKAEEAAVRSHSVRDKAQVAPCPSSAMRLRSSTWGSRGGGGLSADDADIGSRGLREERNGLSTDFTDDTDSGPRFEQSSFPVLAWPSLPSSSIDSFGNHRTHCGNVWPDPISVSLRLEMWRRLPLGTLGRRGRHPIRTGGESPSGERFQSAIRPGSSYLSARSASPREFGHP